MTIRPARLSDFPFLSSHDHHISATELATLIRLGRVSVAESDGSLVGWLRWNLFWDNTPFLNMLFLPEPFRGRGIGREMMRQWEAARKAEGYDTVMISTASDEYAQHFYQKLGYTSIGGFLLFNDPYELIFAKKL
jgi:GNAT superfamily N-acetyltransferase